MRLLRLFLIANAIFSLISGVIVLADSMRVAAWLGISHADLTLQVIGVCLCIFSVELIYQATRNRMATWRALLASLADFAWVVGSAILLLLFPGLFSQGGYFLVLSVACVVLVFAIAQLWAIGYAHHKEEGIYRHCLVIETSSPAELTWKAIENLGDIMRYVPSLKYSTILGGKEPGIGAIRFCEDYDGRRWSEECIDFDSGHSFSMRFLSEAPDFPFPAKTMHGGWELASSEKGSRVTIWWELTLKNQLLAPFILPLLAFKVDRDFPAIVQRMSDAVLVAPSKKGLPFRDRQARLLKLAC